MPARWLQIHHRVWWERDNGTTCLENGVGVCSFHHQEIHRLDLKIVRTPGAPADGPPGRRRRRTGEIAMATYEFRDPTGRLVGQPTPSPIGTAATAAPEVAEPRSAPATAAVAGSGMALATSAVAGSGMAPTTSAVAGSGLAPATADVARTRGGDVSRPAANDPPGSGTGVVPTPAAGAGPPGELDLTWTTDPLTGGRVPTAWLEA
jgi:hypothetical protein